MDQPRVLAGHVGTKRPWLDAFRHGDFLLFDRVCLVCADAGDAVVIERLQGREALPQLGDTISEHHPLHPIVDVRSVRCFRRPLPRGDRNGFTRWLLSDDAQAVIAAPVEVQGRKVGTLVGVIATKFTDLERRLTGVMSGLARELSLHFELASEREMRTEAENARKALAAQTTFLKRIALLANSAETLGESLRTSVELICSYAGWPVGHAYLVIRTENPDEARLVSSGIWHVRAGDDFSAFRAASEATMFRVGEGLPGSAWQSQAATSTTDVSADPRFAQHPAAAARIGASFAFPIMADDSVIAVLEFFARERLEVDRYFLEALETAGTLLGRCAERQRASARLRESELRFRSLTESAADAIVCADSSGTIISWNKSSELMFGYDAQEACGQPLSLIIPEEHREGHERGFTQFLQTRKARIMGRPIEFTAIRKDGARFPIELSISTWQSAAEPLFTGIIRDVSARKVLEEERAREHEELTFLTTAIEHANDAVIVYRVDRSVEVPFTVSYVNDMFERQTGYTRAEAMGTTPALLYGPKTDRAITKQLTEKLLMLEPANAQLLKYRKDGSEFWTEIHMRPVPNANGELECMIAIQRDITARRQSEEQLHFLSQAIHHATDIIIITDVYDAHAGPTIRYVNDAWIRLTGYAREESIGRRVSMLFGSLTDEEALQQLQQNTVAGQAHTGQLRCYRKDGSDFWMEFSTKPIFDSSGQITQWIGIGRDISERVATQAWLELLSSAMEQANDMIVMFERSQARGEWRICYANDMFVHFTGFTREEVLGNTSRFLEGPQTDLKLLKQFRTELKAGKPCRAEVAYYHKDGRPFWVELNARPLRGPDGSNSHTIVLYHDVTEKRMREQALKHEAAHDPLTGIFNRRFFCQTLDAAVGDAKANESTHAILFLDLDGFKPVNDVYGHEAGDMLLVELTKTYRQRLRDGDVFARLGGDEFAVLLQQCSLTHATQVARHLMDATHRFRLMLNGQAVSVGVSIGVAAFGDSVVSGTAALRMADEACYAAKKGGRNRIVVGGSRVRSPVAAN